MTPILDFKKEACVFEIPDSSSRLLHDAAIGISIGASTLSSVTLINKNGSLRVIQADRIAYSGNPAHDILHTLRQKQNLGLPLMITGRKFRDLINLNSIAEPEATEYALQVVLPQTGPSTGIASLGAENFVIYRLTGAGRIISMETRNQCASGTGDFFLQQIKRMNISLAVASEPAPETEIFKVSGRCSVFCKSDCTHALNKGVPKRNVVAGLSLMIAEKVKELLKKADPGQILLVGGVTQNRAVVEYLKQMFPKITIPACATSFEALGAAFYGMLHENNMPSRGISLVKNKNKFSFHQPLPAFAAQVTFSPTITGTAHANGKYILGMDVGSTTTKGVLITENDMMIVASVYLYTNGNPLKASREVYSGLMQQVPENIRITGFAVTGSGRYITALHAQSEGIINEILAHSRAAVHFDKEVDTIIEIGGQDAKYTYLINGVPADYAMNEACSAGTGSFIEEVAHESLNLKVTEIEQVAFKAKHPLNFRDQCAALIGSDIRTAMQENYDSADIVAGLTYSICLNYNNRVRGRRQIGKKIFMQGGVCYNKAIPVAMAAITEQQIVVPPHPGLMGAFGSALYVRDQLLSGRIKPSAFSLRALANREYSIHKPFVCKSGKDHCDRGCEIQVIKVEGEKIPFGGACNKYYNLRLGRTYNMDELNFLQQAFKLTFQRQHLLPDTNQDKVSIGISQSLITNTLFPLYHTFFTRLGFRIILADNIDKEGIDYQYSSFCYPAQIAHGFFKYLIQKNPDFIFMPEVYEMQVKGHENDLKDSNATCVMVSKEANYLIQAFKRYISEERIIHPYLNFAKGYLSQENVFLHIAKHLNCNNHQKVLQAYRAAVAEQESVEDTLLGYGKSVLDFLDKNPEKISVVIIGRDYNAVNPAANKGIPEKFTSRGIRVISQEMLDLTQIVLDDFQSWAAGKKILKAAKLIAAHRQLFAVYITNYSCGPDSMLIPQFRNLMENKPMLTLELDEHTADTGIITRIEAFLDIVNNYRSITGQYTNHFASPPIQAKVVSIGGKFFFSDSTGNLIPITDPGLKILVPSMGEMGGRLFTAALRSIGINAEPLPPHTPDILQKGISGLTGKECLPLILLAGSLSHYLETHRDPEERVALFIITGVSSCRLAQYQTILEKMIANLNKPNVAVFSLANHEGYIGLGQGFLQRSVEVIIINDVLEDVRSAILGYALDPDSGLQLFNREVRKICDVFEKDHRHLKNALITFSNAISANVPMRKPLSQFRYIGLTGEIFVRHDEFSHKWLNHYFGQQGFVLKNAYISEWILYIDYAWRKGVDRPRFSFKQKLQRLFREQYMLMMEKRVKKILSKTGYCERGVTHIKTLIRHSIHSLPLESTGEPALTLGTGLYFGLEKYCGIINVGPFGCLQTRIGEAICTPQMNLANKIAVRNHLGSKTDNLEKLPSGSIIPFLTIESDGMEFPQIITSRLETFTMQAERAASIIEENTKKSRKRIKVNTLP